ncbi:lectin-like domain-containing protein [Agriterribacter sp.]|uniref:lectin-like domain-containing protein n=1 Tax=Agriterribacter sp. TaxID=2821509 RepID=UPI002C0776E3|nr:PKD domain-containing protein [Agriterribacter sp.]HTN06017.1 PKD domain-containing protein [Agriterribacter sp.]
MTLHQHRQLKRRRSGCLWLAVLFCLLPGIHTLHAQTDKPYHLNGNATQEDCNCYTITNDKNDQSGSVWNINKIDLTHPFDYHFNVFLGCRDADGADGIAFVLQPLSTSIGTTGQGLGIQGVAPSVAVAIDTYQNTDFGDPHYDHLAIHLNGDLNHNTTNNIAGPVTALENNDNIEDCSWHIMRIAWNPAAAMITVYMDGKERLHTTIALVQDIFNGDPMVFWGFSGATGGATNHQRFCTSLNPSFSLAENQITCYPEPVLFRDSSTSFGNIVQWFWDFGDGTTGTEKNPGMHTYPAPGNYTVSLNIVGNDGCISDTFRQQVVAGSKPLANFNFKDPPYCDNKPIPFNDLSKVEYGTINTWNWTVNGSAIPNPEQPLQRQLPLGDNSITLKVKTKEGCVSETTQKTITIQQHPGINMQEAMDACKNEPVLFAATNSNPVLPVQSWHWDFGDGATAGEASFTHAYSNGGTYNTFIYALGPGGCPSDTLRQEVTIFATNAFAGNDTTAAIGQPIQLQASGGDFFTWNPSSGLSNANSSNPVATVQHDATYMVTATSEAGCPTTDTLFIKAYKGPEFYIPNAFTPNGDGKNDVFRFTAAGMTAVHYFKVFNRYGQLVYSSTIPSPGWDGSFNGKPQATDTYVWMIEGRDYTGNSIKRKGTVALIR